MKNVAVNTDGNYVFPASGGALSCSFSAGNFLSHNIKPEDYIVMDVTCLSGSSCSVVMKFNDDVKDDGCNVKMGILPAVKTRLAIRYDTCLAGRLFLQRTPGKLKTVVHGRPVRPDLVTLFSICTEPAPDTVVLKIDSLAIYDSEPDYPLEPVQLVDSLGQKNIGDWKGKTKDFDEMKSALLREAGAPDSAALENRSRYGGFTGKRLCGSKGFFSLVSDGGRYWLADPDGYAFFSSGIDCVGIDGDCNLLGIKQLCSDLPAADDAGWHGENNFSWLRSNLYRVFGKDYKSAWQKLTARRLHEWGINTVACWSDSDFARHSGIPYVSIFRGYPGTDKYIFRDFPDVFSAQFRGNAETWARQIEQYKDDAYLIGYFLSNEPNWAFVNNINIAKMTLELDSDTESRLALAAFMSSKYGDISALNSAWGSNFNAFSDLEHTQSTAGFTLLADNDLNEFSAEMIREYIKIPSLAVRALDASHLNLGIRYAWLSSKTLAAGSEYTDIFSFNCYNIDPYDSIERISSLVGKPVMIGEFHFGALDRGLDATGIRGVTNQNERGVAYRYYMHRAASHPQCLGAHYFQLNDQGYLGRFDGENYQIGFIDVCNKPYDEFIDAVTDTNREIYAVANGDITPTERRAEEIHPIFF